MRLQAQLDSMRWMWTAGSLVCYLDDDLDLLGDLGIPLTGKNTFRALEKQPEVFPNGVWHDYQLEGVNFLRGSW